MFGVAGSIVGMAVDVLFVTNYAHRRNHIPNYGVMVALMCALSIINIFFVKSDIRILTQSLILIFTLYAFSRSVSAIGSFCVFYALLALLDVFLIETLNLPYDYIFIVTVILKLFTVVTVCKELNKLQLPQMRTITSKVLIIIFCFIVWCFGLYVNVYSLRG